ncbi:hypothetical protein CGRA01v4_09472 [Colletotrichum graminicola]|nr:hypothetical protein CGRA01v4_09472 [Colletotrichum graminicola]
MGRQWVANGSVAFQGRQSGASGTVETESLHSPDFAQQLLQTVIGAQEAQQCGDIKNWSCIR